ncbi:MAG: Asp-tRNA(Asn)/Glu-tRNA(Gln) amidotransferase subunit GatB [Candidatus Spechtbacterales bacterium]
MKYEPTIGLEIHAELKTKTKMFCASLNDPKETEPNKLICPVCTGQPGTLPVPNKEAIEQMMRIGFALHSNVAERAKFDRKHYFYPDLPKGYQISQYDQPFCEGGYIDIELEGEETKRIDLERVHLEEDTGKSIHSPDGTATLVDFNRAGVPLMELVTKPVLKSAKEARAFAEALQLILRYLGASDAELENGLMRVEVNLSLAPLGSTELGTKVEIKNLNSLRVVEDATAFEIARQTNLLERGEKVLQETRGWDETTKKTFSQRVKEEASDYRYFPEPDIPPFVLTKEYGFDREALQASIPELPQAKQKRFMEEYHQTVQSADVFIHDKALADYYEAVVSELLNWESSYAKAMEDKKAEGGGEEERQRLVALATNYTVKNLRTLLQETDTAVADLKITPENFGEFVQLIHRGDISSAAAREVLAEMAATGKDPSNIVEEKGLKQVSGGSELTVMVQEVIAENPQAVDDYSKGKETALQFLTGQVMAKSRGSANPQVVAELLKKKLS